MHSNRTVADIYETILKFQGHFMEGNGEASMNELIRKIVAMTKWEVFVSYRVASDA